ncbi:hypothetical protein [Actinocatenispora comari]|uniref:hypothetical protein n=1 Tax=Actinocatenispora comari TaxID=2807577 RepID=UPI001A92F453|nr:hypothetical protein [Actinocatenispora comari]
MDAGLELSEPWFRPEPDRLASLVAEAVTEICADHELAGRSLTAVAACAGCDDVAFSLDDGAFALVHLTWTRHLEPEPWPLTQRLDGLPALRAAFDRHQH